MGTVSSRTQQTRRKRRVAIVLGEQRGRHRCFCIQRESCEGVTVTKDDVEHDVIFDF